MGSTGNGKFGDYPINRKTNAGAGVGTNGFVNGTGGTGENSCPRNIENIRLEDVATSEYYSIHGCLLEPNTAIEIPYTIYNNRIVVRTINTGEVVGNIPTSYNHLIRCISNFII